MKTKSCFSYIIVAVLVVVNELYLKLQNSISHARRKQVGLSRATLDSQVKVFNFRSEIFLNQYNFWSIKSWV